MKEKEIQMFDCLVCDRTTDEIDYCFGCGGFLCFECEHED